MTNIVLKTEVVNNVMTTVELTNFGRNGVRPVVAVRVETTIHGDGPVRRVACLKAEEASVIVPMVRVARNPKYQPK